MTETQEMVIKNLQEVIEKIDNLQWLLTRVRLLGCLELSNTEEFIQSSLESYYKILESINKEIKEMK